MWLDLTTTHRQTWLFSCTSTYHSTDLLTVRGVAHLVVHGTTGSVDQLVGEWETIVRRAEDSFQSSLSNLLHMLCNHHCNMAYIGLQDRRGQPIDTNALITLVFNKTRVPGLSCGVVCVIICSAVSVEHRLVTDRRTDTGPWHKPRMRSIAR